MFLLSSKEDYQYSLLSGALMWYIFCFHYILSGSNLFSSFELFLVSLVLKSHYILIYLLTAGEHFQ